MGFLLRLLGSAAGPWLLMGLVVTLAAGAGVIYNNGVENGQNGERVRQQKAQSRLIDKAKADHEADLQKRGWQDVTEAKLQREIQNDLQQRITDLLNTPPKTFIKTVVVPNEAGCNCPVSSFSDEFWVRYRAAGRGDRANDPAGAGPVLDRM